jgi:hypothetical protein
MNDQPNGGSRLSRTLQPLLWFLLMASTLACASNLALGLVS